MKSRKELTPALRVAFEEQSLKIGVPLWRPAAAN